MICSSCGKDDATIKFVQIINGIKTELMLCEQCCEEMGLENIDIPMDYSSFISELFDNYNEEELLSVLTDTPIKQCDYCGLTFDEFVQTGKLGCVNCYDVFKDRIDVITKNIQGSSEHIGRKVQNYDSKYYKNDNRNTVHEKNHNINNDNFNHYNYNNNIGSDNSKQSNITYDKESKIKMLKEKLKLAVKEERYEDAAQIRDEIAIVESNLNKDEKNM